MNSEWLDTQTHVILFESTSSRADRFQFSLRSLLIAMAILSAVPAVHGLWLLPSLKQKHAADSIRSRGHVVLYQWDMDKNGEHILDSSTLGMNDGGLPDFYYDVEAVWMVPRYTDLTNQDVIEVTRDARRFPELKSFALWRSHNSSTEITDAALKYLPDLTSLCSVELSHTSITDEGVRRLAQLPHLKSVSLVATDISDEALKHLAQRTELILLDVRGTDVTERAVLEFEKQAPNCIVAHGPQYHCYNPK